MKTMEKKSCVLTREEILNAWELLIVIQRCYAGKVKSQQLKEIFGQEITVESLMNYISDLKQNGINIGAGVIKNNGEEWIMRFSKQEEYLDLVKDMADTIYGIKLEKPENLRVKKIIKKPEIKQLAKQEQQIRRVGNLIRASKIINNGDIVVERPIWIKLNLDQIVYAEEANNEILLVYNINGLDTTIKMNGTLDELEENLSK